MFHDSSIAVMAMMLLCFSGMLLMFVFIVRAVSSLNEAQKESFHKQQLYLAQIEQQCIDLKGSLQGLRKKMKDEEKQEEDLLLRMKDPLESMLEATVSHNASLPEEDRSPAMRSLAFLSEDDEENILSKPSPRPTAAIREAARSGENGLQELHDDHPISSTLTREEEEKKHLPHNIQTGAADAGSKPVEDDDSSFVPNWDEERTPKALLTSYEAPGREILAGFEPSPRYDGHSAEPEGRGGNPVLPDIGDLPPQKNLSFLKSHTPGTPASFNNEESWLQMVDPHSLQRNAAKQTWSAEQASEFGMENMRMDSSRFETTLTEGQSSPLETRADALQDTEESLDPAVVDRSLRNHVDRVLQEAVTSTLPREYPQNARKEVDDPNYKVDAFFDDSDYEDEYETKPGHPSFPTQAPKDASKSDGVTASATKPEPGNDGESALDKYASRFLSDREDPFHTKKNKSRDKKAKGKKKLSLRRGSFSVDQDE